MRRYVHALFAFALTTGLVLPTFAEDETKKKGDGEAKVEKKEGDQPKEKSKKKKADGDKPEGKKKKNADGDKKPDEKKPDSEAKPEAKGKKRAADAGPFATIEKQVAAIELSSEQKEKVTGILAQYKPKFAEANKSGGELTAEQKAAKKEATASAKADGKKGKELREAVNASLKLTDEQQKAQSDKAKQVKQLQGELKKELAEVLTPEQAEKLKRGKAKKA